MRLLSSLATLRVALQSSCLLSSVFCLFPLLPLQAAIAPLAQDYVAVGTSTNPAKTYLYNPTLLALPNGRLVAGYDQNTPSGRRPEDGSRVLTSDDHGLTWQHRATFSNFVHGRLIVAGGVLYFFSTIDPMRISKSTDNGTTWSDSVIVTRGIRWHHSATNFIRANGNIYIPTEKRITSEIPKTWFVGELSPIVMRAKETDDLTKRESWTFSQDFSFADIIPGYRENDMPTLDYFGIPFFQQTFPLINRLAPGRSFSPMGWLEANIAQIKDPNHYWYDPAGKTFHILLRSNTGGTGYACLAKTVENDDGTLTTSLETAPSGKKILFLPMPGGQMRFHISYDEKTKLYWLLSSQATDSMTRVEALSPERFDIPNNERHRLVLHYSKNLVDWIFAGLVATGDSPRQARHYAAMDIDGEDLVILSRSGDSQTTSAHNGNLITFHRIKNFRSLIY